MYPDIFLCQSSTFNFYTWIIYHIILLKLPVIFFPRCYCSPLTKSNWALNGANQAYLLGADRGAGGRSSGRLRLWHPCFHLNSSSVCLPTAAVSVLCTDAVTISCVTPNWRGLSFGTHTFNIFLIVSNILLQRISCSDTACNECSSLEVWSDCYLICCLNMTNY